jgi:N-acetylglutamate synthase-like GNAT family acetyltransferase
MVTIDVANKEHLKYAEQVSEMIQTSAKQRGTGIAKRTPEYIKTKIMEDKAIIAYDGDTLVGFCYIESWQNKNFVANSGLIVNPDYRGQGIAKKLKAKAFEHSRKKFPTAKLFGITTSLAVMKINSSLGYKPVTFSELTNDDDFWKGCQSCVNYTILQQTGRKQCLCTAMLFDPEVHEKEMEKLKETLLQNS